jgi:hypothetical protein
MNIIIEIVHIFFLDLALRQRKWLIKKSEKKIQKLKDNLRIEILYREMLLKDTLNLCKEINK